MIRSGVRCLSENSESGFIPTYVSSCIGYIDCIFFHEKMVSLYYRLTFATLKSHHVNANNDVVVELPCLSKGV